MAGYIWELKSPFFIVSIYSDLDMKTKEKRKKEKLIANNRGTNVQKILVILLRNVPNLKMFSS